MQANQRILVGITIGITALSLSSVQINSAYALDIQGELNNYWQQLQVFLGKELDQALDKLDKGIQTAVEDTIGELGIPNLDKVEQKVESQVQKQSEAGAFGVNPTTQAKATSKAVEQAIAESQIHAQLGDGGQKQIAAELNSVAGAVWETANAATSAQSANVTQDVLKQMATQNTQVTAILQAAHSEAVKTRLATLGSNKSLLNISKNLDQQEWNKQIDAAASQAGLVNATAQFTTLISGQFTTHSKGQFSHDAGE
jgi:DNA anti-recombination protein RmuC